MTRLTPPPQQSRLLLRPRVAELLSIAVDYPLTLLVAPAGSGKTTALASFAAQGDWPVAWCRVSIDDDPALLLRHLAAAFRPIATMDEERIRAELERVTAEAEPASERALPAQLQGPLDVLVNELAAVLNETTLLIIDDYHQADQNPALRALFERFIAILPLRLRVLLASRYEPELSLLPTIRARGEVYQLGQADLAFTMEESQALFVLAHQSEPDHLTDLVQRYRGWPLALQMAVGGWGPGVVTAQLPFSNPQSLLDEYFTQQVFDDQPPALQAFLLRTAGLRWIDWNLCAILPNLEHAEAMTALARRRCLFLEQLPHGALAYQPLFRSFLERLAAQSLSDWREIHLRAAAYYQARDDHEGVLHHLLAAGEEEQVAEVLTRVGDAWLSNGRARELLGWLSRLTQPHQNWPLLLEMQAAANRQLGHFEKALQLYQDAERAFQQQGDREGQIRTLRGRSEVYLDTVQPAPAVTLLKQALKLLPPDRAVERAEILQLQAENWANRGRADIALILENAARKMEQGDQTKPRPNEPPVTQVRDGPGTPAAVAPLPPRLLLRSGRLNESRRQLEAALGLGSDLSVDSEAATSALSPRPFQRSMHREPLLLLSLIYALLGSGAKALAMAKRGLLEALQGSSPLTLAIAHMRTGHAFQVVARLDAAAARRHYTESLALAEMAGVLRTRVEVYLGLTLLHGHGGDLVAAESTAREGLHITEAAGDEWVAALLWLALGGAAVVDGDLRALSWLEQAQQRFLRGGDTYGQAVVALWMALLHMRHGQESQAAQQVARLLSLAKAHGYEGLLTAPTLFGPRDMAMLVPLLLKGRTQPEHTLFAQQLLRQAFPTIAADETVEDYHPGYTLRIQMLGSFRVWRGWHEIQAREWQREKARQLFQLLLTYRGHWLQREQICAWLWPDSDLDAAERQFKVTLNALNAALEPQRPPRTSPFFIRRQGLAYSFAPSYGVWIDVDEFELRVAGTAARDDPEFALRNSQIAVQLYKGDYLAEALYDSWTLEERERLLARFLATATALAAHVLDEGDIQQAVQLCEQVLRRDRGYEEAYQILMRAHASSGSRSQALRSYTRCIQALRDDLGIEPLPETTALYERIKRNEKM